MCLRDRGWGIDQVEPPPPPQPDANFSFAFAVEFSPAKNLTLTSPTRLVHADAPYDFAGFLVLCHYEVSVPELQLICGGDMVTARFAPVPIPAVLERADERAALLALEALLTLNSSRCRRSSPTPTPPRPPPST